MSSDTRATETDEAGSPIDFTRGLRPEALLSPESGIVEVFNYGRNRQGLIPLWVGESDLPTPSFICEAAARSLEAGETFYTYQRGIPELRTAIAAYMTRVYGGPYSGSADPFRPERFFVTIGGMHALQLAMRLVAGVGDEVIVPTPAWPNFRGVVGVSGATTVDVPMHFGGDPLGWTLSIDDVERAVTPRTTAIIINSPSNPTGWIASAADLEALLALARRHDLWIVADEIYGRFVYDGERAPSFHDIMRPDDRILFAQTLSKNWTMTGWRIGWLEAPESLGPLIENLVQYSTSGVPVPTQRAAIVAIENGEPFLRQQVERAKTSRDILCDALAATGRVRFARPQGAFYLFASITGETDMRRLVLRMVDEAGLGMAPGGAFGTGGDPYVRICFARQPSEIAEVARRFVAWLGRS